MSYQAFLESKAQAGSDEGVEPVWIPDFLFDFQAELVEWATRKGRAAIFADCGMGKTPMQLVWSENVLRHTNRPVLILTPLAVAQQTIREGDKFGIEVVRSEQITRPAIYVSNYERLHHFDQSDFGAVVCDESSILKSFDGVRRAEITEFMRRIPYRLLCTATAAPNDYTELGTSSEALGYLGHMDMLNRFFRNTNNTSDTKGEWKGFAAPRQWHNPKWRFKGHAEKPFWRWVCSWARALRRPSDLGFDDAAFILPELIEEETIVKAKKLAPGMLFALPAITLQEQREERRRTIQERCEVAAESVADTGAPAVCWCQLNDEGDLLERLITDGVQVSGKDADEAKEEKFSAFGKGDIRVLITKPVIGAWGLNWQHCNHTTCFASHSFEQYYQSIRRFWRFGQTQPVRVQNIVSDGEVGVLANLQRKARQADTMFAELVRHMVEEMGVVQEQFTTQERIPEWLSAIR